MLAALLFASLTLAFFWPAVAGGAPFSVVRGAQTGVYPWKAYANGQGAAEVQADQAQLSYPWDATLTAALRHGALPFWSGDTFNGGYPLFANGSSAEFYPPRLALAWIAAPEPAHAWFSALHLFLAGLFAYLFAISLGIGWFGAVLTGISWMFASFNIAWLPFEVIAPVMACLPLDLLLVRRAWSRATWSSTAVAGGAIGLTMMAGHVLYMALTVLIALVYGGCLALTSAWKSWGREHWRGLRTLLVPATISAIGSGIAAIALLPMADNFAQIGRASFPYDSAWLAPPRALLHALFPLEGPLTIASINVELTFIGSIPACLAVLGLFSRRAGARLGTTLVILGGLGAVGGPVTWLLYHANPLLQIDTAYGRLFEWWAFGLALLGGVGLDRLLGWLRRRPPPIHDHRLPAFITCRVVAVGTTVVTLTAVQLVSVSSSLTQSFNDFGQSHPFPTTPFVSAIQAFQKQAPWPARVLFVTRGNLFRGSVFEPVMGGDVPQVFAINEAGGYDSAVPQRTLNLQRVLSGESVDDVLRHPLTGAYLSEFYPDAMRYDLLQRTGIAALAVPPALEYKSPPSANVAVNYGLSTRYKGTDGRLIALRPDEAGPRVVGRAVVVDSDRSSLARFTDPSFDYTHLVVLERSQIDRLPPGHRVTSGNATGATVDATDVGVNTLTLRGHTRGSGWLVIPENWDAGWKAEVNGQSATLLRGNYAQQVLLIPSGAFVVRLTYEAPGFPSGMAISLTTVAVVVSMVPAEAVRRRRRQLRATKAVPAR